jgi:hypothetical protein
MIAVVRRFRPAHCILKKGRRSDQAMSVPEAERVRETLPHHRIDHADVVPGTSGCALTLILSQNLFRDNVGKHRISDFDDSGSFVSRSVISIDVNGSQTGLIDPTHVGSHDDGAPSSFSNR